MAEAWKIFIGGGGDDWFSHIVEAYAADYAAANPELQVRYYSWTENTQAAIQVRSLPPASHVTIVGHSYGGDAAFKVAASCPVVQVLISIDPVSHLRTPWGVVRAHCLQWLNVRAQPDEKHRSSDDLIAWIGGKYPAPPSAGQPGAPDYAFTANATHGAFRTMMRTSQRGVSGTTLLGGRSVA